ncbi:MAG: hypothetical protein KDI06_07315, partial [Calditrichaeota bacterium]|nr:hypothetical protein [Calditrichota bacterium]
MRFSLRRIVFLPAIVLLVSQFALAQGNPSPAGMAFVDGAPADFAWIDSAGATVIGVPGDDNEIYPINLPFDFWYYNDLYTANTPLTVSSNGWISFDAGLSGSVSFNINLDLVDGADFVTLVGPFWDNWLLNPNSQISYKTIGLAPYRRLVISYSNVVKSSNPSEGPVSFQVILSETANTIKFQYLRDYVSDVERGSLGTVGVHFDDTNGGGSIDDYAQFLYESTLLQNNLAIQFFASDQLTANASFNPSTGTAGTGNQSFELTVSNIDLQSSPNVENMGKADVLRIANGFGSDALSVTGVTVDGTSFFVNNSTTPPTQAQTNVLGNLATWYYDSGTDSLFIQVANAAISDEIVVRFTANVPQTAGSYTFNGDVYTRLNVSDGATISPAITVNPVGVAAYTVTPAGDFTAVVGNPVNLVLRAQDQFGNPVANSQTVDVAALGGDQVFVNSAEAPTSLSFAGEDSIAVTVETFVAQDFTLRFSNQVGGTPTIQSGQLTFLPDVPNKFDKVAGDSANIFVSRSLDLKVFLKDQYGNPVADSTVTFAVNPGNGGSVSPLTDITLATGEAETRFTAPATPDTSIITVSAGAALDSFIVYTLGEIAYFLVEPTNFTPIAGQTFSLTVTAYDIHNNQVTSDNSTIVNLTSDGTGVTMPASGQLSSGEVTFTNAVSNTVAENFRITATSQGDPSKTGTSGLIRVSPAAATTVVKVSGDTTGIFAGNNQKLSVEVQDNFGNTVSGATVNFVVTGGGGDLSADIATSNASGIAESILTTGATAGTNTVTAQVGAFPLVTFTVTTVAGGISYFEV